jgi:hypothetical protein
MNTRARCRFKLTVTTGRSAVRNLQALNWRRELAGKSWLSIPGPSLDSGGNEHHAAEAESLERSVSSRTTRWPRSASQQRKNMKLVKSLVLAGLALAFTSSSILAGCCDATVDAGKKCEHKCCVKAAKDGKVCEKCHPKKDEKK